MLSPNYEPTEDQLFALRTLAHAPAYLIIRDRPWCPTKAILPIWTPNGPACEHLLADCRARGEHCQLVRYRPDEEDLGPFEPSPWPFRLWASAFAVLLGVAIWNLWRLLH